MRRLIIIAAICLSVSGCGAKNITQDRELVKIRKIEKGDKRQDGKLCFFPMERGENGGRKTMAASCRETGD